MDSGYSVLGWDSSSRATTIISARQHLGERTRFRTKDIGHFARELKRVASSVMRIGRGDPKYMKDSETAKRAEGMLVDKIEESRCTESKAGQLPARVSLILNYSDGTMRLTI